MFIIGGLVGSAIFGTIGNKTHKFKVLLDLIVVGSAVVMILFTVFLYLPYDWIIVILVFLIGFWILPIIPVGFEYVCEITFPIGEAMTVGFNWFLSQIIGIIHLMIISVLFDSKSISS